MIYLGYLFLLGMGVTLGLIGAGGSILTIPILVYVFKVPVIESTTYSLLIVGASAAVGCIRYRHTIAFKRAFYFAIPSSISMSLVRYYVIPHLPSQIGHVSMDTLLMSLLLSLMIMASYFMITDIHVDTDIINRVVERAVKIKVLFLGAVVGALMGLLGAGGGFLIVPTLVLLLDLPMLAAVPTSLFIIALNSIMGFIFDQQYLSSTAYQQLFCYIFIALAGMWLGVYISTKISGIYLKKIFGWFVLMVALMIGIQTFF